MEKSQHHQKTCQALQKNLDDTLVEKVRVIRERIRGALRFIRKQQKNRNGRRYQYFLKMKNRGGGKCIFRGGGVGRSYPGDEQTYNLDHASRELSGISVRRERKKRKSITGVEQSSKKTVYTTRGEKTRCSPEKGKGRVK